MIEFYAELVPATFWQEVQGLAQHSDFIHNL